MYVSYGGSQCRKSEKYWNRASMYVLFFKYFDKECIVCSRYKTGEAYVRINNVNNNLSCNLSEFLHWCLTVAPLSEE